MKIRTQKLFLIEPFIWIIFLFVTVASFVFPRPTWAQKPTELVVWGMGEGENMMGIYAAIDEFEKQHPGVKVKISSAGRNLNPQKLMTAIVGGVAPDVIHQDRFTISGWASRDAFTNLDPYIARDRNKPFGVRKEDFYPACWNEATYNGHVYAIPFGADDRALYYNKNILREAGFVDARGQVIPPKTWEDLLRYCDKINRKDKFGHFVRLGFSPIYGPASFYLYAWQNGGHFISADGRTCTMDEPAIVAALDWWVKFYDHFGGRESIPAYETMFVQGAFDPFFSGKLAMKIDGNWKLQDIATANLDFDFGVVPVPVPKGKPYITWSGGFSFAIPKGARHPELAWEFIKWMTSPKAWDIRSYVQMRFNESRGKPYLPQMSANRVANELLRDKYVLQNASLSPDLKEGYKIFVDLMNHSKYRPVTPVGQRLWNEQIRAFDMATYHRLTPYEALHRGKIAVQLELNRIFNKNPGKPVNWKTVLFWVSLVLAIGLGFLIFRLRKIYRRMGRRARGDMWIGFLTISPWMIGFLVFLAGPIIFSILLSFMRYDVIHPARWVGVWNYATLIKKDPLFWKSLWNTLYMIVSVPLGMSVGLSIAVLLNAKIKGMAVYRTIFYLPAIVPEVASSILWIWVLQPSNGLLNNVLSWFHIHGPLWLQSATWSKPSIILMGLWGAGASMIIWLAGLKGIPEYLYEAAEIDGAGPIRRFFSITLPMLSPYIFFNMIMGIIGTLQIFTSAYIMTQGGPIDSTLFYVYYLFNNAFEYFKMGYASAMAWILFIIILALTLFQLKMAPKWVHYEAGKK